MISVFANSECFEGFGFVRGWGRGGSYGGTTWIRLLQFLWSELTSFCWHSRYSASQLMALKFAPIKKYGATPLTAAYWPHSGLLSLSLSVPRVRAAVRYLSLVDLYEWQVQVQQRQPERCAGDHLLPRDVPSHAWVWRFLAVSYIFSFLL